MQDIQNFSLALIEDFRGFLLEGGRRLEVKDDELHAIVAKEELERKYGYIYKTGMNPIIDIMKKGAIYITKIKTVNGNYQRSIGYIKRDELEEREQNGIDTSFAEIIKKIALGNGYEVDEYSIEGDDISIINYKAKIVVKRTKFNPKFKVTEGDRPVIDDKGKILGYVHNGKFYSISNCDLSGLAEIIDR